MTVGIVHGPAPQSDARCARDVRAGADAAVNLAGGREIFERGDDHLARYAAGARDGARGRQPGARRESAGANRGTDGCGDLRYERMAPIDRQRRERNSAGAFQNGP